MSLWPSGRTQQSSAERTIDAIRMDGWRIDVGYPEDREEAERRLEGGSVDGESEEIEAEEVDAG